MKKRYIVSLSILPFLLSLVAQQNGDGKKIFKEKCSSCHTIGGGKLTGPDLKEVTTRRKEEWLIPFIKSSRSMIKKGDPVAVQLYNENNKVVMPDQRLSDLEIKEVLKYIRTMSTNNTNIPDSNLINIRK